MPRDAPIAWTAACAGWLVIAALCAPLAGAHAGDPRQRYVVQIQGFAFSPTTLRVSSGDTVVWINRDLVPHTVTARDKGWGSGTLRAGESWEWVVDNSSNGVGLYFCRYHPGMQGTLKAATIK